MQNMPSLKYNIQIPEPCQQSWHKMLPEYKGRYCPHCAKTVVDFTAMTDAQIVDLFEKSNGKLCGRFESAQLSKEINKVEPVTYWQKKLKEVVTVVALIFGTGQLTRAQ